MADRFGTLPLLVGGGVVLALSCLALATAVYHQNFWFGVLPALTVLGVGMGVVASPMSTAIMNSVDDRHVGRCDSLAAPHDYELGALAPGRHRLTLRIDPGEACGVEVSRRRGGR